MNLCETCANAAYLFETYWDGQSAASVEQKIKYQCTLVSRVLNSPDCPFYIEHKADGDTDTVTNQCCGMCHNAYTHPFVPEGVIYCTRLNTEKPRDSWCENFTPYRPKDNLANA